MHTTALRDEPLSDLHPGSSNNGWVSCALAGFLLTQAEAVTTRSAAPAPESHTERDVNEVHAQAFCDGRSLRS